MRRVQRNFVDVFDEDVRDAGEVPPIVAACEEWKGVARADAVDLDSVEHRARRAARPAAAEQSDLMPARRQPAEDLMQVNLGAARLGIVAVLPVHEKDAHYIRPMRRANASSTPFTNFALAVPL